jgi:signal transduction histidine kinase
VGELRAPKRDLRDALEIATGGLPRPRIHLEVHEDVAVDDATAMTLVRCTQEIMTNTVRHADAEALHIEVARNKDGGVRLAAFDDGRGADQLQPGNGLSGISERIEALGGHVEFRTGSGEGMHVVAEIPAR